MEVDTINNIMSKQVTEREAVIYLLIESGLSFRELGSKLGVSHENIRLTYNSAKAKIQQQADAGIFGTEV